MSIPYKKNLRFLGILSTTIGVMLMLVISIPGIAFGNGQSGTTLTASKTAVGDCSGVTGTITVTNGGAIATEGLTIVDEVYKKVGPNWVLVSSTNIDVSGNSVLDPGETGNYNYDINFAVEQGVEYKNTVHVTITNHSGHLGTPFGPSPSATFSIPDACFTTTTSTTTTTTSTTTTSTTTTTIPTTTSEVTTTSEGQTTTTEGETTSTEGETTSTEGETTSTEATTTTVADGGDGTTTTVTLQVAGLETEGGRSRSAAIEVAGVSEELPFTGAFQSIGFVAGGASTLFGAALLAISSRFRRKQK